MKKYNTFYLSFIIAIMACKKQVSNFKNYGNTNTTLNTTNKVGYTYNTIACIMQNKDCPGQRCRRDPYPGSCKKESACECVAARIIETHYPGVTLDEWLSIDHSSNRAFMIDMWLDNPELFYHPDSIPR